jgi:Uma2 family endonuclease
MPENSAHTLDCAYLLMVLLSHLASDSQAVVLNDVLIYWDDHVLRHHGPDIAVIFGVRQPRSRYTSFQVAQEGVRPELIIEITSPETRQVDLRTKRRQYWQARVPFYVVVDERIVRDQRRLCLLGYRRGRRGYERLPLNAQGRLWLQAVQLFLGQENGRVALHDAQGQRLGDLRAVEQARQAAEQRVQELEAELRRLRGEK